MRIERIEWDGADAPRARRRLRALAPELEEVTGEVAEMDRRGRERGDEALRELGLRSARRRPEPLRVDPG